MKELIRRLFFPPRCAACHALVDWYETGVGLCEACFKEWRAEKEERCAICGESVSRCGCMPDAMQKAKCEGFRKLNYYDPKTRKKVQNRVVYTVKESRVRSTFEFLAKEMLPLVRETVGERSTDEFCITYLPRTRKAKRRYGVDQAEQLARALSSLSGIEWTEVFERDGGVAQKGLSPAERARNAQKSYRLKNGVELHGKRILLIDDVVTTGAGMAVGARLCRRAGAASIFGLALSSDIANREIQ